MVSELELLAQAQKLDTRALAEIYDLYSPRLYRYAFRLLGDACTAEDCVAETFSRFLQALRGGRGPREYLQSYLYRSAHNFVVDHYRRQRPESVLDENMMGGENTEGNMASNLRQQRVRLALGQLTGEQQQVVALKFLEGWGNEEIARILNKPVGAVKSLQHRALAHLQKILLDEKD